MKNLPLIAAGLAFFFALRAQAETFEQQAFRVSQRISGDAAQARQTWAASQAQKPRAQTNILNPLDMLDETKVGVAAKFIRIQPGTFVMGSLENEEASWGNDQHSVTLTKCFEIQATEVTQLQYFLVTGRNPAKFRNKMDCDEGDYGPVFGRTMCLNHPVEMVSWFDAMGFANKLSEAAGLQPAYTLGKAGNGPRDMAVNGGNIYAAEGYRLPTEAEWEYAVRGGLPPGSPYWFGSNVNDDGSYNHELANHGWYLGNCSYWKGIFCVAGTHAVARKKANPFGLYDMYGNVSELVQDCYDVHYGTAAVTDPVVPAFYPGTLGAVFRGGSWNDERWQLRSASRDSSWTYERRPTMGFRLVRPCR